MATNRAIDDKLIEEARRAGGHKTKKEAVTVAGRSTCSSTSSRESSRAFGTFDFDPGYDYKAERRRKRV